MVRHHPALARAEAFAQACGLRVPILLAPMAGACPPALSIAVAKAGGMGACGALMMRAEAIGDWAREVRASTNGAFQMNIWIPDPPPARDAAAEARVRAFLAQWGPEVPPEAGDALPPDFEAQCAAMVSAGPAAISSIMGLFPEDYVSEMKARGIRWFAKATTVAEARAAEAAGADAIVAQGAEAGGHRGAFDAARAETAQVGLFALLPAVTDAVSVPVIASGGIADGRGIAAALILGASAVEIGTGLLRTPEADLPPAWSGALAAAQPEDTMLSRAFSGRAGRTLRTGYAEAAASADAPRPAPYPVQRNLTAPMRAAATRDGRLDGMQAWAGQSARLGRTAPATEVVEALWIETLARFA